MNLALASGALSLVLAIAPISAEAIDWIRCDTCNPGQAQSLVLSGLAPYERVVVNPAQRWAQKFLVESQGSGPGCPIERSSVQSARDDVDRQSQRAGVCAYQNVAYPVELSADELALMNALADFYVETQGSMNKVVEINAYDLHLPDCTSADCVNAPARTAHDVIRSSIVERDVRLALEAYASNPASAYSSFSGIYNAIKHALDVRFNGGAMSIMIKIRFSDGSEVQYEIADTTGLDALLRPELAQDAAGMRIMTPDNIRSFVGSWVYQHDYQAANFLEHAQRLGVPIYGPGGGGYGPGITCVFDPVSQQTMCRRTFGNGG